jgi:hypothetical protein
MVALWGHLNDTAYSVGWLCSDHKAIAPTKSPAFAGLLERSLERDLSSQHSFLLERE